MKNRKAILWAVSVGVFFAIVFGCGEQAGEREYKAALSAWHKGELVPARTLMEKAVRKLSGLPAKNLKLDRRGQLKEGYYADVVVFDPATIQDHATFVKPHQYATGVLHVFVNGVQVLEDGEHTGATPGRVVRGPGWTGRGATK